MYCLISPCVLAVATEWSELCCYGKVINTYCGVTSRMTQCSRILESDWSGGVRYICVAAVS